MTGDYGSTTIHAFELGYRVRLGMMGPVRPFVAASLGAVLANSGDWSPVSANTTSKGGAGRLGFGVEYPVGDYAEDLHLVSAYLGFGVSL